MLRDITNIDSYIPIYLSGLPFTNPFFVLAIKLTFIRAKFYFVTIG